MNKLNQKTPCPPLKELERTALLGQAHIRYAAVIAHLESCLTCAVVYSEIESLADLSEAALSEESDPGFRLAAAGAGLKFDQRAWTSIDRKIVLRIETDATGKETARLIGVSAGSVYYLPLIGEEPLRLIVGQSTPLPLGSEFPDQPSLIPEHDRSDMEASSDGCIPLIPLENDD